MPTNILNLPVYSFEALRAKIVFTEGAHKHKLSRPKFERMREVKVGPDYGIPADAMGYCAFVGEPMIAGPSRVTKPHELHEPTKNYGDDRNTLVELLEAGKL